MVYQPYAGGITDTGTHGTAATLTAGQAGATDVCAGEVTIKLPGS
jgi:hypothetical protein